MSHSKCEALFTEASSVLPAASFSPQALAACPVALVAAGPALPLQEAESAPADARSQEASVLVLEVAESAARFPAALAPNDCSAAPSVADSE
jgi:hypothetical protein